MEAHMMTISTRRPMQAQYVNSPVRDRVLICLPSATSQLLGRTYQNSTCVHSKCQRHRHATAASIREQCSTERVEPSPPRSHRLTGRTSHRKRGTLQGGKFHSPERNVRRLEGEVLTSDGASRQHNVIIRPERDEDSSVSAQIRWLRSMTTNASSCTR